MRGRALILAVATAILLPTSALAHGSAPLAPGDLARSWSVDPFALVPLLALHLLYGRGLFAAAARLGRPPNALPARRIACFLAGELALVVALLSPLAELSGTLLSAHMVQHVLLVAVAPALLILGRPEVAVLQALPRGARSALAGSRSWRAFLAALGALARPLPATALHAAALWLWHAPALFDAAATDPVLHRLEHVAFFATALLFWRAVLAAERRPEAAVAGLAALLVTMVHSGFLGALLTFGPREIYPAATRWAPLWGLSPIEDQQLAGAIMWGPAGAVYLVAAALLAARLLEPRRARAAVS